MNEQTVSNAEEKVEKGQDNDEHIEPKDHFMFPFIKWLVDILKNNNFLLALFLIILLALLVILASVFYMFYNAIFTGITTAIIFIIGTMTGYINKKTGSNYFGVEFIPFAALVFIIRFDLLTSMILIMVMTTISGILAGSLETSIFVVWITYFIVWVTAFIFNATIFPGAVLLTIEANLLIIAGSYLLGLDYSTKILALPGNTIINYALFRYLGEFIMLLL